MKKSMLRKVLTMLLIAVSSMQASAQFEKYTSYLNTSLTGLGLSYSKYSRFKMGVQATGGYFVEDCWMLYGRFGFEHQGARGDRLLTLGGLSQCVIVRLLRGFEVLHRTVIVAAVV